MPTVALYVPARLFRDLGSDEVRVRGIALDALSAAVADDGLGAGEPGAATPPVAAVEVPRSASPSVAESPAPAPSPSFPQSVKEFRGPDPKGGKK